MPDQADASAVLTVSASCAERLGHAVRIALRRPDRSDLAALAAYGALHGAVSATALLGPAVGPVGMSWARLMDETRRELEGLSIEGEGEPDQAWAVQSGARLGELARRVIDWHRGAEALHSVALAASAPTAGASGARA